MAADEQKDSAVNRWKRPLDHEQLLREETRKNRRLLIIYGILGTIVAILIVVGLARRDRPRGPTPPVEPAFTEKTLEPEKPTRKEIAMQLPTDPAKIKERMANPTNPVVRLTTSKGDMLIELYEDKVPNTVANMVQLAESGYYKGMSFHRIIPDFMAQGGCPNSKQGATGRPGTGGPGYTFADEFHPDLKHTGPGILSMANAGPNSNGSQFFLCFVATPHLDGKHSVFGRVIAGEKVLDKLQKVGTPSGKPKETVRFNIEVVLKQDHPYQVEKL